MIRRMPPGRLRAATCPDASLPGLAGPALVPIAIAFLLAPRAAAASPGTIFEPLKMQDARSA